MSVFYISALLGSNLTQKAIKDNNLQYVEVKDDQWVVSFKGTSKELSDLLGISIGENQSGIVVAISGYYGFAPNDIWEFIAAHWND